MADIYKDAKSFWDNVFFKDNDVIRSEDELSDLGCPTIESALNTVSSGVSVIDFGCGSGWASFYMAINAAKNGHTLAITALDQSRNAIKAAETQAKAIDTICRGISFIAKDDSALDAMPNGCFDGLFSSNVLDVIPKDAALIALEKLRRVLRLGATAAIMLNPYADEAMRTRLNMQPIGDDAYTMNGILRCVNLTNHEWEKLLGKFFAITSYEEFRFSDEPETMKRRLFILKR